jgi:hypothetical protein
MENRNNSFTSQMNRNFETKKGNMNIEKNSTLTFFDTTGKISLKEGDRPFGPNGVMEKANKLIKTENSTQIMKNNDNKTVKNIENIEITYTLNKNIENRLEYSVEGNFDATISFDCEFNKNEKSKKWFVGSVLRHILIGREHLKVELKHKCKYQ